MKEQEAIERVVKRMQIDRLTKTGSLPDAKLARDIEDKVKRIAQETENRKRRR